MKIGQASRFGQLKILSLVSPEAAGLAAAAESRP
jgi:hypothetical protein